MPKEFSRTLRVSEQIERELAMLIQQEIKDPRIGMITVSAVEVSRDLCHAKVFVTRLGDEKDIDQSVEILNGAAKFLRHALASKLRLRIIPQLKFIYDKSVKYGSDLSALIDSVVLEDKLNHSIESKE